MNWIEKKNIVELAASWVGYQEKAAAWYHLYEYKHDGAGEGNFTRFGRIADLVISGKDRRAKDGYAWCCMFLLSVLYESKAGHQDTRQPLGSLKINNIARNYVAEVVAGGGPLDYYAGCAAFLQSYKKRGLVSSIPHAGDFIIYTDQAGRPYHIGIVEKIEGNDIITIEGNTSNKEPGIVADGGCVARKKRKKSARQLYLINNFVFL